MTVHYLPLHISKDEWLRYYAGEVTHVQCRSTRGQSIAIPAHRFRAFTTSEGLNGLFKLTLEGNRFVALEKIS
jgi:hypothetical protein